MCFFVGDPFRNRSDPGPCLRDAVGEGSDRLLVITLFKNTILHCSKANNNLHSCTGNYRSSSKNLFASQKLLPGMTNLGANNHRAYQQLVGLYLVLINKLIVSDFFI